MKIRTFTRFVFALTGVILLSLMGAEKAKASHAMGADLSYECIDPATNQYKIVLRFYRDCFGIPEPSSVILDVFSVSCNLNLSLLLTKQPTPPGTTAEVSPLCPTSLSQSTCNGGSLPGVQVYTYTGTITLPQACADWTFAFDECCRNDLITNIVSASSEDLYIEAVLNNTLGGICNNSPVFTTLPVPYICANQPFSYNQGAVDADGDSLVYELITPLGVNASLVSYSAGFSPAYPLTTTPPNSFNFSSSLGQISFTPSGVQVAVITVLVKEYRNGVFIGSTMRDIQVVVLNIPGCGIPPVFSGVDSSSVSSGFFISPQLVQVCPGQPLAFSMVATNPSGDSVFLESNAGAAIPAAVFNSFYTSKDTIFGTIAWIPTGLDTGINNIIITVKNKNCPISNIQSYAVTIQVLAGTYAGPDVAYCPSGGPVQLQVYGGTQFTWSPVAGLDNIVIANPKASPAVTTEYVVTSNLSNTCKNRDSIIVTVVPDFNYTLTQSDDTICRFEYVNLNVAADNTFGPYTYRWSPANRLDATNIAGPVTQPNSTTQYYVTVTSQQGCIIKDSLRVVVEGQGPLVEITANKYKGCTGDTIKVNSNISLLPCGLNFMPCTGTFAIKVAGATQGIAPATSSRLATPYGGFWNDGRIQMLYRASELQALGMQRGTITDLAFNIRARRSSIPYNGFTIKMSCTGRTELVDYVPGLPVVYGPASFTPSGPGFNTHTFDTPYDWDGESNIIVEICFDNPDGNYTRHDTVYSTPTGYNSVVYYQTDFAVGCDLRAPYLSVNRPNTQFVYCADDNKTVTYTWAPTNDLYVPDSLDPYVVLQKSTTYTLNVAAGNCTGTASVTLNIDTSFKVQAGNDTAFCAGGEVLLGAQIVGTPPPGSVTSCGVRNSPCTGTPVIQTFLAPSPFASTKTPFDGSQFSAPEDERTQMLYRASDLIAAGFTPGTIGKIGFNIVNKASPLPFQNFSVKMACTFKNTLSDLVWEPTTLVFNASTFTTIAGWNDIPLQTTFDWGGNANIVVEICWDNVDNFYSFNQDQIQAGIVNYNGFHTVSDKLAVGCNLPTTFSYTDVIVPSMRVFMCDPPPLPVTYEWNPANGLSAVDTSNPIAAPNTATLYYVTAYFGGRCPRTDSVLVTLNRVVDTISVDTSLCQGFSAQLNVSGGNAYLWSPDATLSCADCPNPVATPSDTVTYHVLITDTNTGCFANDSVTVNVFSLSVTPWFTDTLVDQGTSITLGGDVTGGSGNGFTYLWSPGTYLNRTDSLYAIATPVFDSVLYTLSVSSGPCVDTAQVYVRVNILESPVKMPNAFSPNGDGHNDGFYPVISNDKLATVKTFHIYNRYGALVHDGAMPWDGKFKGQGQPAGTFVYYIVISRPFKADESIQGSFSLLR